MRARTMVELVMAAAWVASAPALCAQTRWTIGPALQTIGAENGGAATEFSRIHHAQRLPGNVMLVVDGATNELRFFGADGRFLRRAGGTGSGPSEFRRISGVVLERDSLYVFDANQRKLATFSRSGDFAGTQPVAPTGSAVHSLRLYRLAGFIGGNPILAAGAYPGDMRPVPVKYWDTIPTLRYTAAGTLRDTIGEFAGMDYYSMPKEGGDVLWGRMSSAVVAQNKLYMTDGGRMTIRAYGGSRAVVSTFARSLPPRPVAADDVAALLKYRLSRARNNDERMRAERHVAEWPRAEFKPWISDLVVDAAGFVWAEQYAPFWDSSARVWHVFDPQGKWVTEVTMPLRFRLHQVGTDFVVGVALDSDDVESVAVLALKRS